ncbi:AlpA family phage regulatory protein [Novosphingobium sp. RD2P27]|uniref:AlpA family phage regulatory protein n=1 Tax=Novosphingobium kalidii TaxID=3230299 RepID=A0ABV2CW66_9SPHN
MTPSSEDCDRLLRIDKVKLLVVLGKTMIYRLIQQQEFPAPNGSLAESQSVFGGQIATAMKIDNRRIAGRWAKAS